MDPEPKQQINRIAKNMIGYVYFLPPFFRLLAWCVLIGYFYLFRLTYDATLAELTSLEEMDAVYRMDDGQIHQDVIAKLWQVYSSFYTQQFRIQCQTILLTLYILIGSDKQLPKPQHRGAIIILGMLGLARRSDERRHWTSRLAFQSRTWGLWEK
jgi:condensin complex subunit 1